MKTDDLIAALEADQAPLGRPVWQMLAIALALALAVSVAGFMLVLGPRPDIAAIWTSPFFELKFVVTGSLLAAALAVALRLSRPEADVGRLAGLFAIPVTLLIIGMAAEAVWARNGDIAWTTRLIGANAAICLVAIPSLAMPLLGAALYALRHGATTRPVLAGALAGLTAAALAATLYALHCTDDSPLFVATWYSLAAAAVAVVGALAGRRVLRF